jgi:putative serine protease PepD
MGPVTYPDSPRYYPPLDSSADQPPRPPMPPAPVKRGPGAGTVIGLLAAAGLIAVTAGTIGGGVGYLVARETLPTATVQQVEAAGGSGAQLPSVVPGSIAEIAARVQPAVVQLNVSGSAGEGTGSGFVVSEDGYIITNNHVAGVAADGGKIDVVFSDGTTKTGTLVGASTDYDLAVVKVDGKSLPTVPLGSSADLAVGDSVIAVGSPLGLSGTVTTGIVSALNRPVTAGGGQGEETSFINAIQTDAAINPGNSGGPLLDGNGSVIGVNSAIATMGDNTGGQTGSIGLGFAIPIDVVKRIAQEIRTTGHASTPIIGVELDMQYTGPGAQVNVVTKGGPAEAAGLQTGDLITQVNGTTVADPTQLVVVLRSQAPGDTVNLTIERNGQTLQVPITLGTAGAVAS